MAPKKMFNIISCWLIINFGILLAFGLPINEEASSDAHESNTHIPGVDDGLIADVHLPPLVFPNDPRAYKIFPLSNETALKILQHSSNILDKKTDKQQTPPGTNAIEAVNPPFDEQKSNTEKTAEQPSIMDEELKNQVEYLQSNVIEKHSEVELEERFRHPTANFQVNEVFAENIETVQPILKDGHIAAIYIGIFILFGLICYVSIIIWRFRFEKRYGMRERLVTQDDFSNNNDTRQFQL